MNLIENSKIKNLNIKLMDSKVEAGSGSLPEKKISSIAIVFEPESIKCSALAEKFRKGKIPVVGFIKDNKFYIDLKAVLPNQLIKLSQAINLVYMAQVVIGTAGHIDHGKTSLVKSLTGIETDSSLKKKKRE